MAPQWHPGRAPAPLQGTCAAPAGCAGSHCPCMRALARRWGASDTCRKVHTSNILATGKGLQSCGRTSTRKKLHTQCDEHQPVQT